ncbi:MAG TPA: hypothetical protein VGN18_05865 [Jatrophihabitans sp.]|jgi:hypothetical protein|uniref:hypothetical protein n=1 Tax=Jatrophihabitans sp. TaxID=1932789 RepID=UPI002DFC0B8E|nr:hypothetical protein [Jatrophihabitans sp.]
MTPAAIAEALFVSSVQPSEHLTDVQLDAAVDTALTSHGGIDGCACACAAEYGDHPDTAADRMRWALQAATTTRHVTVS